MLEYKEKDENGFLVVSVEELADFARMDRVDESNEWTAKQWRIQAVKLLQAVANRKIKVVNERELCAPVELTLQPVVPAPGVKGWNGIRFRTSMEIAGATGILYKFKEWTDTMVIPTGLHCILDAAGNITKFDNNSVLDPGNPNNDRILIHVSDKEEKIIDLMLEDLEKTLQPS